MGRGAALISLWVVLLLVLFAAAPLARVTGQLTRVSDRIVFATLPAHVRPNSMMFILSGQGEDIAGMAVVKTCSGRGPYQVKGEVRMISKPSAVVAGKEVYVNDLDAVGVMSSRLKGGSAVMESYSEPGMSARDLDLKFYYYASGQTAGYGALGLGYERTVRIGRGLGISLDGSAAGVGTVSNDQSKSVDRQQFFASLNGKLKLDFGKGMGVYAGYRWNRGEAEGGRWAKLTGELQGQSFSAPSALESGTVLLEGLEYGLTLRPSGRFSLSAGFIPSFRNDFGSLGVRSVPAYTGEMRFGVGRGALRLRGITSQDYWLADFGVTIR